MTHKTHEALALTRRLTGHITMTVIPDGMVLDWLNFASVAISDQNQLHVFVFNSIPIYYTINSTTICMS